MLKIRLFGLMLLLVLCGLAIAWINANAKGGPERVDYCRQADAVKWTAHYNQPITSFHPEKGDFLIDEAHPCPPDGIVPQPQTGGVSFFLPLVLQNDCEGARNCH